MTPRYALYFKFADELAAIAALPQYRVQSDDGEAWNTSYVDAGVPVVIDGVLEDGFHLNLLLNARDESLEAINGWLGTLDADTKELIAGARPHSPQRVFA